MSRMVSVDADEWAGVLRRLRSLETVTNLFAASVTSGRVRIGGTATLLVDSSGGVVVHGSIDGDGEFTWSGTLNADGTINLTGPLTATGATNLNGPTTVTGTLDVSGITTLLNNLIIGAGGKITAGAVTVDPGAGGTGGLSSTSAIRLASPQVFTTADLSVGDDLTVSDQLVVSGATSLVGTLTNSGMTNKSAVVANVYVDSAGRLFRVQ